MPADQFLAQARPRPTHTVVVPGVVAANQLINALLAARETFTVEPSVSEPAVWRMGVFDTALPLLAALFGPMRDDS